MRGGNIQAARLGGGDDGAGERVGGVLFDGGGDAVQSVFVKAAVGNAINGGNLRPAFGQRASFVQHDGIDVGGFFHRRCVFEPNAVFHRLAHANHNRGRRRQTERARTGNHQNSNGVHQCNRPIALNQPSNDKSQKRNAHDSWHEYRRRFIGYARNRCFTALCFRERIHHVAEQGLAAELRSAVHHAAFGHQRACQHFAACLFLFRIGFAGKMTLVRPTAAAFNNAIGGNAFAVIGADKVADLYLVDGQLFPFAFALHVDLGRRKFQQQAQAVQAGFFSAVLQKFAQRHKTNHHHAYFKIHVCHAVRRVRAEKQHINGIQVNRYRADGNQHVHVRQPALNACPRAFVKRDGQPKLHYACQHKLPYRRNHPIVPPDHHPCHADKERNIDGQQKPQPPAYMRCFFGLRQRVFHLLLRTVTGFLDDFGDIVSGGLAVVKHHLCLFAGEVHPSRFDKIFFVQHFLNARSTCLTGHAFDLETDFLLHGKASY